MKNTDMAADGIEKTADLKELTFEQILGELTTVVERLEKGNLPLEDSLTLFSRGIELQNAAQTMLDGASARLEQLLATTDNGVEKKPVDPSEFF